MWEMKMQRERAVMKTNCIVRGFAKCDREDAACIAMHFSAQREILSAINSDYKLFVTLCSIFLSLSVYIFLTHSLSAIFTADWNHQGPRRIPGSASCACTWHYAMGATSFLTSACLTRYILLCRYKIGPESPNAAPESKLNDFA